MIDEMIEIMKKRANYFFKEKIYVHVTLKSDRWFNGKIVKIEKEFFEIEDFKLGKNPIFWEEVLPNGLETYRKEDKNELERKIL